MIVTDAWHPQVNGVVRTLATLAAELRARGLVVEVVGPERFATLPCPSYPDIRLALWPGRRLARIIADFAPDALHVATEGPLGMATARWAKRHGARFTTAFHTRFAEYVQARTRLPPALSWWWLRRFHAAGAGVLVATESLRTELHARGFEKIVLWSRGVDLDSFVPVAHRPDPAAPLFLYVGRVAVEKNLRAFLDLDLPGTKRVVGDGPQLAALRRAYPQVAFAGTRHGDALAAEYAAADVLVFPSRTDTFGLVMLEALASGTPVAAYPVAGPSDVFADAAAPIGALDADLRRACLAALNANRGACRAHAERFSWSACAATFAAALVPAAEPPLSPQARWRRTAHPSHR